MRGTIKQRSKGSWSLILDTGKDSATGKRRQQWFTVRGTKKEAERRLAELINEIDKGIYIKPSQVTVEDFLQRWLQDYATNRVRSTTFEGYQWRAKSIAASLGNIRLADLRPEHIQHYYSEKLTAGFAPLTVIKHHHLIRSALATAVRWQLISTNVADLVDPPRKTHKEMRALAPDEIQRLLDTCKDTQWQIIFHTLIWTGLRRSELLGLRWKDLDITLSTLRVTQVLHQMGNGTFVFSEPKTGKSRRAVSLTPASCLMLQAHRDQQAADAQLLGVPLTPDSLVFSHSDGTPRRPDTITKAFHRYSTRARLEGVRLHDLRHTHASLLIQLNANPKTISDRLGHASVQITMDVYAHLLPGVQEAAVAGLDALLEPARQ
jgi:integrase